MQNYKNINKCNCECKEFIDKGMLSKITLFSLIPILGKNNEFFYNNLGVCGMITYFIAALNKSYFSEVV